MKTIIEIQITQNRLRMMKRLMKDCGLKTIREFFNNAFTLFMWAVDKQKAGAEIGSLKDGVYEKLSMPAFYAIQKKL